MFNHPSSIPHDTVRRIYALKKLAVNVEKIEVRRSEYNNTPTHKKNWLGSSAEIVLGEIDQFLHRLATRYPPLPSDLYLAILPFVRNDREILIEILRQPGIGITVVRAAVRLSSVWEV